MCFSPWYRAYFHYIHWWKLLNSRLRNPRERNMVATFIYSYTESVLGNSYLYWYKVNEYRKPALSSRQAHSVGYSFSAPFCSSSLHVHASRLFYFPSTLTPKLISASLIAVQHRPVLGAPTAYLYVPFTTPDTSIWPHPNMSKPGSQSPRP